jgi:hypothetical protein
MLDSGAPWQPLSLQRGWAPSWGLFHSGDIRKAERNLSLGSRLRFVCDHAFGPLMSLTPELPHVSGRLAGGSSHLAIVSLQASFC